MVTAALAGEVTAAGVHVSWAVVGDALEVTTRAETSGWVLVGFHSRSALAGSRLVMAAVTDAGPRLEEHVADPPNHAARSMGAVASMISVTEEGGTTTARFQVPLDPEDPTLPTLVPGQRTWLWLATSNHDDFQHHSARREGVWVSL
ncbi:MAG: hypothetical protein ACI8RZ_006296 [Myxococcota bacterium]|jgi:hypothetical protein